METVTFLRCGDWFKLWSFNAEELIWLLCVFAGFNEGNVGIRWTGAGTGEV